MGKDKFCNTTLTPLIWEWVGDTDVFDFHMSDSTVIVASVLPVFIAAKVANNRNFAKRSVAKYPR